MAKGARRFWGAGIRGSASETAAVTIRGIELAERIKKDQFNLKTLTGKPTTDPGIARQLPKCKESLR